MRMNRKWLFALSTLSLGAIAAAITFQVNNPLLNGHVEKLKQAGSLSITFTVNRIGSELEDQTLVLSKPGIFRYETPSAVVIANGTNVLTLDKKSNQYFEEAQTPEALKKVMGSDVLWAWSAFTDDTFMKPVTAARAGASRPIKGVPVKEVNVSRGEKLTTLFVDDKLGFARGVTFQEDKGGQKTTVLVIASEIAISKDPMAMTDKAFTMPASAQKVDKSALALTFKDSRPIFAARCGCHMNQAPAGLSLANHKAVMAGSKSGSVVTAGDPDGSILLQVIKGTRAPKMPPQGNLTTEQMDTLTKWIKDGAKE